MHTETANSSIQNIIHIYVNILISALKWKIFSQVTLQYIMTFLVANTLEYDHRHYKIYELYSQEDIL